ncbi:MAG: hypothetical protein VW985_13990 [Gammaproteobacteria bacterium]
MARLAGKVALITGAASRMGREHSVLFAEEGALSMATDIDAEGLAQTSLNNGALLIEGNARSG